MTELIPVGAVYGYDDDGDCWAVEGDTLSVIDGQGQTLDRFSAEEAIAEWGPFTWFDLDDNELTGSAS